MKTYMVTCDLGGHLIKTFNVDVPEKYVPMLDNMTRLKEAIVKKYKPHIHYAVHCSPSGYTRTVESNDVWPADKLNIIALSRLDM